MRLQRTAGRLFTAALAMSALAGSASQADIEYVESDDATGTSMAVVVGRAHLAHTTQFLPVDGDGKVVGKGRPDEQIQKVIENLSGALLEARSGLDRLVKVNVYVIAPGIAAEVRRAFSARFRGKAKPAVTFVAGHLAHPDAMVAMDAIAVTDVDPAAEGVMRLSSVNLYGPKGGSHVAILPAGPRAYVSGQAEKGDLAQSTRRTLESLRATLGFLGLKDSQIVQIKAFMHPISAKGDVEKILAEFFGDQPVPPVVFVEWTFPDPIEIELIASGKAAGEPVEDTVRYLTPAGMKASPIYSRVTRMDGGKTIYVSGLYGKAKGNAEAEILEIFESLGRMLEKTGSDFKHLAKATYYVSTEEASRKLNEVRPKFYDPLRPPAASKAMVAGVGVEGRSITLDMIAATRP